jgi:hypothetical protein
VFCFFCLCHNRRFRFHPTGRTKYSEFSDSARLNIKFQ